MKFYATHTPSWDPFTTVTLGVSMRSGAGVLNIHEEVSPKEAREYAAKIIKSAEIVEQDQEKEAT